MNIFLVSNMYPSKADPGSAVFVKNFEQAMIKQGVIFTAKAVMKGLSYVKLFQFLRYVNLYIKIITEGLVKKYDFLYVHFISHSTVAVYVVSLIRNKTIVFNVHGNDLIAKNLINRFSRSLIDKLIVKNRIKAFVVPSEFFKNKLCDRFNTTNLKVIISPSGGIDLKNFKVKDKEEIKKDNGYRNDFIIGYVSRIENNKGWRLFVRLVQRLNKSGINTKGIIAGTGSEINELKQEIVNMNLSNHIDYLGTINQQKLTYVYNKMDVFIFPTLANESLGLVGIEAMACGTIVIGSDIGGIRSYLEDGKNGYLFKTNEFDDLVQHTKEFYSKSKQEKDKLYLNAIKTAERFDKHKVTSDLIKQLRNLYEEK